MQAICVVGPESSGNRLMTRLLIHAGCQGDGAHVQRWDTTPPTGESPIVWLRSLPHAGAWIDVLPWIWRLQEGHYTVRAVVMTRDWWSQVASQVEVGHVRDAATAEAHLRRAYATIFGPLRATGVDSWVVSYEALCQRPHAVMRRLCERLELTWPETLPEPIIDGNTPYYAEETGCP